MGNFIKKPGIPGLNRIAIVCNSPVNQSKIGNPNPPNYKAFATAKACGFNVVMYPGSDVEPNEWIEYMDKALIHCKKLGIKLISNSPILNYTGKNKTNWHTEFVEHYIPIESPIDNLTEEEQEFQQSLDALVGWQFKDEPLYYNLFAPYHYYIKEQGNKSTIMTPEEVTEEDLKHLVQDPEDGMSKKILDDGKIPDQDLDSLVVNHGGGYNNGSNNDYVLKQENCDNLKENYTTINDTDTVRPVFANLAVDSHLDADKRKIWIGHNSTYNEFLDEYISKFNPPLLSYDYYPIETLKDDKGKDVEVFQEDAFYQNLLMFANKSKQYNIPFWAYCLCLKHLSGPGGRHYPYPTEGMMRIEAFSALAFGAQGIVYWQYRLDDLNSETSSCQTSQSSPTLNEGTQIGGIDSIGSSTFMGADENGVPVYGHGITTSVWQSIKNINRDIIKENKKFFNCKFISHQICFGDEEYSMNGEAGLDIIKESGKGFLMTHIETPDPNERDNNGKPVINKYIVIVSRDPFNSQEIRWRKAQCSKSSIDQDICTPDFNLDDNNGDYEGDNNSTNDDVNNASLWYKATLKPGGHYIFVC